MSSLLGGLPTPSFHFLIRGDSIRGSVRQGKPLFGASHGRHLEMTFLPPIIDAGLSETIGIEILDACSPEYRLM